MNIIIAAIPTIAPPSFTGICCELNLLTINALIESRDDEITFTSMASRIKNAALLISDK
jgi:hypothetical protein